MIFDKSKFKRHEYKVIKRTQSKYVNGKLKSNIVYLVYRRIRAYGIWFWWSGNFQYYSWDGVNTNRHQEFESLSEAKKHILWVINRDRNGKTMLYDDEIVKDSELENISILIDPWRIK